MLWNILSEFNDKKDLVDQLLLNRGIEGHEQKELFLNPPKVSDLIKDLPEKFKKPAKKARELVNSAIENNLPIVIHGDYDADGICAAAILSSVIRDEMQHEKTYPFIPNRFEHGYGITESSVDACLQKIEGDFSEGLLISVDAGITAVDAVEYAKKKGFKIIITDHHQKPSKLPKADAIVWNDDLVGSGIAWVMGRVLGSKNKQSLGLAALATITDLQPVTGLNRSIVKEGLVVLNNNPSEGLKALHELARRRGKEITTYDLGWVFGPRINATGRLGDASVALELLQTEDKEEATRLADRLNKLNSKRQDKTLEMYNIVGELDKENLPKIIFTADEGYHEGIIGLVAAKLVQTYHRPTIVVSVDGEVGKGSVRSIKGVDIIAFLREFEELFEDLGGHPMAAGFTIKMSNVSSLQDSMDELVDTFILDEHLEPSLDVDAEIPLNIVDVGFIEEVDRLKPFGIGNRSPLFVSRGVGVTGFNTVGRDSSHLAIKLVGKGKNFRGIFFGKGHLGKELSVGDRVDIVYSVERNEFNGQVYVNIVIRDLKKV